MSAAASLTYADLAARWGVDRRTIRRWVAEGRLRARRLGHKTVRFDPRDVEEFWDRCGQAPPPPRSSFEARRPGRNPVEEAILARRRTRQKGGTRR